MFPSWRPLSLLLVCWLLLKTKGTRSWRSRSICTTCTSFVCQVVVVIVIRTVVRLNWMKTTTEEKLNENCIQPASQPRTTSRNTRTQCFECFIHVSLERVVVLLRWTVEQGVRKAKLYALCQWRRRRQRQQQQPASSGWKKYDENLHPITACPQLHLFCCVRANGARNAVWSS